MADRIIELLPSLSQDDFNASTDYILVQKPGGGTYKMLASYISSSLLESSAYFDRKSINVNNHGSGTIEFFADSLFETNSAFSVVITTKILSHGSISSSRSSYNLIQDSIGAIQTATLVKQSGAALINNNSIGGTFSINLATFQSTTGYNSTYNCSVNSSTNNTLRLSISGSSNTSIWSQAPANSVKISAIIQSSLRP